MITLLIPHVSEVHEYCTAPSHVQQCSTRALQLDSQRTTIIAVMQHTLQRYATIVEVTQTMSRSGKDLTVFTAGLGNMLRV